MTLTMVVHPENILVFATNIKTKNDKRRLEATFNANEEILTWNIDQDDIDCVLRVVSKTIAAPKVIELVKQYHFSCIELE